NYGLGHLSERYISQFPFKGISIDQSFLLSLISKDKSSQIFKSSLNNLVKDLQLEVQALNVTREEELSILRELGCSEVAGPLFSSPLTEKEVEGVLTDRTNFHHVLDSVSAQNVELSATKERSKTDDSTTTDENKNQNILSD